MDFLNFIKNLCVPSMIYLILGIIEIVFSVKSDILGKTISLIFLLLITYLLDYVCKTYGQTTSWYMLIALYLLPFIIGIIIFFIYSASSNKTLENFFKYLKNSSPTKIISKYLK